MLSLTHKDDGKQKYQSHEVSVIEGSNFYNKDYDIFSHDFFDLCGYGATKEEAIDNFKKKFEYLLNEWISFGKMLFETDIIENNMSERS